MNPYSRLFSRHIGFLMLARDGGESGGGGKPGTIEEQLSEVRSELATAQSSVSSLTTERDTALRERDEARNTASSLQEQFDAATQTATTAQSELARLTSELGAVTTARDTAVTAGATKDGRIKNLEALCRIKGLDTNAAPPVIEEPKAELTAAQWQEKYDAAKTPADKAEVISQMEAAAARKSKK